MQRLDATMADAAHADAYVHTLAPLGERVEARGSLIAEQHPPGGKPRFRPNSHDIQWSARQPSAEGCTAPPGTPGAGAARATRAEPRWRRTLMPGAVLTAHAQAAAAHEPEMLESE